MASSRTAPLRWGRPNPFWAEDQRRHAWSEGVQNYALNGQINRLVDIILNHRPLLGTQPQLVNLMMRAADYEARRRHDGVHDYTLFNHILDAIMPILERAGFSLPGVRFLHDGFMEFMIADGVIARERMFRIGPPDGGEWPIQIEHQSPEY